MLVTSVSCHSCLPFDDPGVAHATRMVLAMPPAAVFSTLVDGDDRCRGS